LTAEVSGHLLERVADASQLPPARARFQKRSLVLHESQSYHLVGTWMPSPE
jgi:hypothetical protein